MMRYGNVAIPAGLAWSSPFARRQGSLAGHPGGTSLFTGCAAGDTGAAVIICVDD